MLLVDLDPIDETSRRTDREIDARYQAARPRLFGALLDLLSNVLSELPNVDLKRLPRMADFGRLLFAMDRILNTESFATYVGQRERIAETVIESDPVALAIQTLVESAGCWEGTPTELLNRITPEKPPKGWPRTPQGIGGRLKRLVPALQQAGIIVSSGREGHPRTRWYRVERSMEGDGKESSASSASRDPDGASDDPGRTAADDADNHLRRVSCDENDAPPQKFRSLCVGRLTPEEVRRLHERERREPGDDAIK